jgi:hypothetical protein
MRGLGFHRRAKKIKNLLSAPVGVVRESLLLMASAAAIGKGAESPSKRSQEGDPMDTDEAPSKRPRDTNMEFEWLGQPLLEDGEGQYYEKVQITSSSKPSFTIQTGDTVTLTTTEGKRLCLVDRFYTLEDGSAAYVEGNYFFSKQSLSKIFADQPPLAVADADEQSKFLSMLRDNEYVVGKTRERCLLTSIEIEACMVKYVPETDDMDQHKDVPVVCRFRVEMVDKSKKIKWKPFLDSAGDDEMAVDDDGTATADGTLDTGTALSGSDDDSASDSSVSTVGNVIRGEGATLREEIQVGPEYQVNVQAFAGAQAVKPRGSKLVYKANAISDEELAKFLDQVAPLHAEFLQKNKMLMMEPYLPLDGDRVEQFVQGVPEGFAVSGSFMSSASMMSGRRVALTKETNPEVLLEILADHGYDAEKALEAIRTNTDFISTGWTRAEKAIFDDGFRRHEGELRLIGLALRPTKSNKDVVDYHYRFKIPDQFRKYQEKKREQAVRMARCIETRKYSDAMSGTSSALSAKSRGKKWSEKSAMTLTESKDERIRTAKDLLLDVKEKLGKETLGKVAAVVRQLQISFDKDAKEELFKLLENETDLQRRFLDFLPKRAI